MTDGNVLQMDLSPTTAKRLLSELARDSKRVFFTNHAEERMQQRGISRLQVLRCLQHGNLIEGPARDVHGKWVVTVEVLSAGDVVTVVAALDHDDAGNFVLVITTYL